MECLVRLFGMDLLHDTFAWVNIMESVGIIFGPPIGGALFYVKNRYDAVFYFPAACNLCAATMFMFILYLQSDRN